MVVSSNSNETPWMPRLRSFVYAFHLDDVTHDLIEEALSAISQTFCDLLVSWTQDTRRTYALEFAALYAWHFELEECEVNEEEMLDMMADNLEKVPSGVTLKKDVIFMYDDFSKMMFEIADVDALHTAWPPKAK
ncbi:hypothetical protein DXG03_004101 [Asterophora parasitica]|uniref:Uncharacterized protein n=1 Tax=Asterophora parasitica TaxID=117018 RepID=A0A9P7K826_9AGAR|nr:hypothetical protein DXG03_004101 [Asterophora parasitica]